MKSNRTRRAAEAIAANPWASLQDALLLSGAMIVAILLSLEYDLFRFNEQLSSEARRITLAEMLFLTVLLAVGIAAFILRRLSEHRSDAERRTHQALETHRLRRLANRDPVTRLLNQRGMLSELAAATAANKDAPRLQALLLIGIDGIERVNDVYGRATGNLVLRAIGERFRAVIRPTNVAARLDVSNEFAVLAPNLDRAEAQVLAQELIASLDAEILVDHHTHKVGAWIGATVFDGPRRTPAEILHEADLAMRRAKETHQSGPVFYNAPSAA